MRVIVQTAIGFVCAALFAFASALAQMPTVSEDGKYFLPEGEDGPRIELLSLNEVRAWQVEQNGNFETAWSLYRKWDSFIENVSTNRSSPSEALEAYKSYLRPAAELGLPEAQEALAILIYAQPHMVAGREGMVWAYLAAVNGRAIGTQILALHFSEGRLIDENPAQVAFWSNKIGEDITPAGNYLWGDALVKLGGDSNITRGVKLIHEAGEAGYGDAAYRLGQYYFNGTHVDQDVDTGLAWHERSIDAGFYQAQADLGLFYAWGMHVEKDIEKSLDHLLAASRAGYGPARMNLGLLIFKGVFESPKPNYDAYVWLAYAQSGTVPKEFTDTIQINLDAVGEELSFEERVEALKSVKNGEIPMPFVPK